MRTVRVTFADGNSLVTNINGTEQQIRDYYLNNVFNIGQPEDNVQAAVKVEFKEWDVEMLDQLAEVLEEYGLVPGASE